MRLRLLGKLDDNGYPTGQPQTFPFDCGYVYDVFLDETSGKMYVACTKPL